MPWAFLPVVFNAPHTAPDMTVLVVKDQDKLRIQGMSVVRVKLFFSFTHHAKTYACAFVEWLKCVSAKIDPKTGIWKVKPDTYRMARVSPPFSAYTCFIVVFILNQYLGEIFFL